ncbi:hypothetical protein [Lacticaseibacillus paracasei]|uniref:hypothetical protein n=1 Tax=Lacticaseibacillus paracasei TaxID=1597 RepID=UPI000F0B0620|nr:hypothetical protein [Lacticaseibacillus paracasei]RND34324.1 hypothetical protein FAM18099_02868 [Lacticaseibacillus paracasei]
MKESFWGKLLGILTDGKHLFFTFAVALSSFIIYHFGLLPQYNRYLVVCSVTFSLLLFVEIVISVFYWTVNIILKHRSVENLVNDSYCLKVLYCLYKNNGNPLDLDNLNGKVISLLNAGLIYKVREIPLQFHSVFDEAGHEYSSYNITSLGEKYLIRKLESK